MSLGAGTDYIIMGGAICYGSIGMCYIGANKGGCYYW